MTKQGVIQKAVHSGTGNKHYTNDGHAVQVGEVINLPYRLQGLSKSVITQDDTQQWQQKNY